MLQRSHPLACRTVADYYRDRAGIGLEYQEDEDYDNIDEISKHTVSHTSALLLLCLFFFPGELIEDEKVFFGRRLQKRWKRFLFLFFWFFVMNQAQDSAVSATNSLRVQFEDFRTNCSLV